MIRESVVKQIGAHITKSSQLALQADSQSRITFTGEPRLIVTCGNKELILEALVAQNVDADVLAGVPFIDTDDIAVRLQKGKLFLGMVPLMDMGKLCLILVLLLFISPKLAYYAPLLSLLQFGLGVH